MSISSWLGLIDRRSSEVREMNTLATRANPRFIPASAARQAIAEAKGKSLRRATEKKYAKRARVWSKEARGGEVGRGQSFPRNFELARKSEAHGSSLAAAALVMQD
jgi:hypothetical protein